MMRCKNITLLLLLVFASVLISSSFAFKTLTFQTLSEPSIRTATHEEQLQRAATKPSQHHVGLRGLGGTIDSREVPHFMEDERFHKYLRGGANQWKRVKISDHEEYHPFLVNFVQYPFVESDDLTAVQNRINELGGCNSKSGSFNFHDDARFLPPTVYLVHCTEDTMKSLLNSELAEHRIWVGAYLPEYKAYKLSGYEELIIIIISKSSEESQKYSTLLSKKLFQHNFVGVEVKSISEEMLSMTLPSDMLSDSAEMARLYSFLTHQSFITYIEEVRPMEIRNHHASWILQSNQEVHYYAYNGGFDGSGEIVGVSDSGLDQYHCFFYDPNFPQVIPYQLNLQHRKIVNLRKTTTDQQGGYFDLYVNGHGTHVAGTVAGNPAGSGLTPDQYEGSYIGLGVAKGAKLTVTTLHDYQNILRVPNDLEILFGPMYNDGARIISNSWGADSDGVTSSTVYSRSLDAFLRKYPDTLILMAAGNEGDKHSSIFPNGKYTITSPAIAKNVLAVGSTLTSSVSLANITEYEDSSVFYENGLDQESISYFSSRGPINPYSGRVKPEVVAPGDALISSSSHSSSCGKYGVAAKSGTSMATPAMAGMAAILRQYLRTGLTSVSGPMLKAFIIATTQIPTGKYYNSETQQWLPLSSLSEPKNLYGHGRPNLMNLDGASVYVSETSIGHKGDHYYEITVPTDCTELIAVVSYYDVPESPEGTDKAWNDLDLYIEGVDFDFYRKSSNSYDTTMMIREYFPMPGRYNVNVYGYSVDTSKGIQKYALVVLVKKSKSSPSASQSPVAPSSSPSESPAVVESPSSSNLPVASASESPSPSKSPPSAKISPAPCKKRCKKQCKYLKNKAKKFKKCKKQCMRNCKAA